MISQVPRGHWQTTTFVAGLRSAGLIAPLVLDGPMSSEYFRAYMQQFLVPTLNRGALVILDNLSSHKQERGQEAIRSAGADVLYLPPNSPDRDPIEKFFAKLKSLLRMHAERTVQALWKRVGQLLERSLLTNV